MYKKRRFKKSVVLKAIRKNLESGSLLSVAIKKSGVKSRQTIENWRNQKRMIDGYILECVRRSNSERVEIIEDAHFEKMKAQNGSPTDYIFYLTNMAPDRWKDRRAVIGSVNVNTKVNSDNRELHIERCSDAELRKIIDNARQA